MVNSVDIQTGDQFEPDGLNSEEREGLIVIATIALGTVPLAFVKTRLSDKDADLVDKIA